MTGKPNRTMPARSYFTIPSNSCSRMNLPSLYCSLGSYARSYFHPTSCVQVVHVISRTICRPVVICRSSGGPSTMFTLTSQHSFPSQRGLGTLWRKGMLFRVGLGMPKTSSVSDYGGSVPLKRGHRRWRGGFDIVHSRRFCCRLDR